jgi:hypothetical protein
MSSTLSAAVVLACTFGGALFGVFIRKRLPGNDLDNDSKDTVKLIIGLIATLTALVLGLLISSAHSAYVTQTGEVQRLGAQLIQIDRILADFGQDGAQARHLLRNLVASDIDRTWRNDRTGAPSAPFQVSSEGQRLFSQIASLSPSTNLQRFGQARMLELLVTVGETRRLLAEQAHSSLSSVFLVVLVAWLTLLFFGFGLFARFNRVVFVALFTGALSVAAAVFVIVEETHPYSGSMQVSRAPLRDALNQMNP